MSAAFSAIMITGALVLPDTRSGMIDASTTRSRASAVNPQTLVDHGQRVAAHPAGARRVIDRLASSGAPRRAIRCPTGTARPAQFRHDVRRERRRLRDAPRDLDAADHDRVIAFIGEIVGLDGRVLERMRRPDLDAAAAVRPQLAHRSGERRELMRAFARLVGAQGLHVELDVRAFHVRRRAREDRHLARRERERASARGAYCRPIQALRSGLFTSSLSVRSRVLNTSRTCR